MNSILARINEHAQRQSNAIAIFHSSGNYTFSQLNELIEIYAQKLAYIASTESFIAIHLSRTPHMVALILACWKLDKAYIPIDPKHPNDRKQKMLEHCQPGLIICNTDEDCRLFSNYPNISLTKLNLIETEERYCPKNLQTIAYILYTSGSTGEPKGIAISHPSVLALMQWAENLYSRTRLACVLASTTITFDLSIFELFVPLYCGTSIYLVDSIFSLLEQNGSPFPPLSLINTVPSAARELVRLNAIPRSVNTINLAGEALTWDLVESLYRLPFIEAVYNLWGPSEATTYSSWFLCPRNKTTPCNVPIGYAIQGSQICILDKNNKLKSQGELGEIGILGEGLAIGYYKNAALTQQKFILYSEAGQIKRIYKTGDLGFIDAQGILHFKGRIDLQVKVRGFRIELEEIENNLNALPDILEAVVTVINQQHAQQILAGIRVQDQSNKQALINRLREQLAYALPEYMLPNCWHVTENLLPRTPNGKLCRKALVHTIEQARQGEAPIDDFEKLVFVSLGHSFDANQSYLTNGGDSLTALHLLSAIQEKWEHQLTLLDILNQRLSINELAKKLKGPKKETENTSEDIKPNCLLAPEKRMWQVLQAQKYTSAYNVGISFTLKGLLDSKRFIRACHQVFSNHPSLHSNYCSGQKGLVRTLNTTPINILHKDYSSLENKVFDLFLERLSQSIFEKTFDLEQDCLVRAMLIKKQAETHYFLFCAPHILIDGLALQKLLQQISLAYNNPLATIETFSAQEMYVIEQSQHHQVFSRAVQFWYQQYKDTPVPVNWPQQKKSEDSHFARIDLDPAIGKRLAQFARAQQLSVASLSFYLFNIVLYRFGLGKDLVIGLPVANRSHNLAANLILNLSNTLPLRTQIEEEQTLSDFIQKSYPKYLEALSHQGASIDLVITQLQDQVSLSSQMFNILFSYMDFAINQLHLEHCEVTGDFYQQPQAKAPLVLSLVVCANNLFSIRIEAQDAYFDQTFIQSLSECYAHLLSFVEQQWHTKLNAIQLLPPKQMTFIHHNLGYKSFSKQAPTTLIDWLTISMQKNNPHIAIIDGKIRISYEQLYHEALSITDGLKKNNIHPGSGIGIAMAHSWKLIAAIIGTLFAGCHYVPLDRRNPKERIDYITQDAQLAAIISDKPHTSVIPVYLFDLLNQHPPQPITQNISSEQIAYIIYTSGTTGRPKGVPISHSNIVNLFAACQTWGQFSEKDIWTLFHSYAFDFSVWEIFGALLFGSRLVIVPENIVSDSLAIIRLINQHQVTVFNQTPTAFKNILLQLTELTHQPRMIIFGGESLNPSMLKVWWETCGTSTTLINMYGITEITVHATYQYIMPRTTTSLIGKPLKHLGMVVLDNNGELAPVGVAGELYICGMGVSKGYINKEGLTKEKFKELTLCKKKKTFYRSGDSARLNAAGAYEYLGRLDKQIKLNGFRIEQEEIITALKHIEGIKHAEIKLLNKDGLDLLIAYYISEAPLDVAFLKKELKALLPAYAIPALYVHLKSFPMTINGKIDVESLPEPSLAINCGEDHFQLKTAKDKVIHSWRESLGSPAIDDKKPFFEHGGNSMKAIILVNHLGALFKKELISIIDIFRYPTINEQVEILTERMQKSIGHE